MTNQNETPATPALNIDFSHRLAVTDYLTDSVDLIADRAIGVLSILSMQFHESENMPVIQSNRITALVHRMKKENCRIAGEGRKSLPLGRLRRSNAEPNRRTG